MSRRDKQPIEVGWSDNGQMIRRVGAKSRPRFLPRARLRRPGDNSMAPARIFRDPLRSSLFRSRYTPPSLRQGYPSVISWNKINFLGPEDTLNFQIVRAKGNHLPFRRPHRRIGGRSFDVRGKSSRRQRLVHCASIFSFFRLRPTHRELSRRISPRKRPLPGKKLHATSPCGFEHGLRQKLDCRRTLRHRPQHARFHLFAESGFQCARVVCQEQLTRSSPSP